MLGDPLRLIFAADHEAGDILEEQQGNAPLAGEFDEMRALLRAFAEQHAVIGQDRYRHAPYMGEAADERGDVKRLELVKFAAVDDAGDALAHVIGGADALGADAVQFFGALGSASWGEGGC